jgi:hypothetical protein
VGIKYGIYGGFGAESSAKAGSISRNCIFINSAVGASATDCDYGAFYNSGPVTGANSISTTTAAFNNYANNDFTIVSTIGSTFPRNRGVSLASTFSKDMNGNVRGSDGSWDVGAFEYGAGGVSTNPVISVSPSSLTFGAIASGTTVTNVVVVANTGAGTLSGSVTAGGQFSVAYGGTYSLGAGQNQSVGIRYTPSTANDSAVLNFSGGGGASVSASGQVLAALPGLSWESYAGVLTAPFVSSGTFISQPAETGVTDGGRAMYAFTITDAGNYVVQASVNAPTEANNSFFVNVDAEPTDPTMIWDVPLTTGFAGRNVSWRGSGTTSANEFTPKVFNLTAGSHQLIIRGREAGAQLGRISILKLPPPPANLRVVSN